MSSLQAMANGSAWQSDLLSRCLTGLTWVSVHYEARVFGPDAAPGGSAWNERKLLLCSDPCDPALKMAAFRPRPRCGLDFIGAALKDHKFSELETLCVCVCVCVCATEALEYLVKFAFSWWIQMWSLIMKTHLPVMSQCWRPPGVHMEESALHSHPSGSLSPGACGCTRWARAAALGALESHGGQAPCPGTCRSVDLA